MSDDRPDFDIDDQLHHDLAVERIGVGHSWKKSLDLVERQKLPETGFFYIR